MLMDQILISILSGAVGGSILSAVADYIKAKSQFKTNHLKSQIDNLYGPLYIILMQSEKYFNTANKIQTAYIDHFCSDEWSREQKTQENLEKDSKMTIGVSNLYISNANANNEGIFNVIKNNFSLLDIDDIEIVDNFMVNYVRLTTEHNPKNNLPFPIYSIVGKICFLPDSFRSRIMEKFATKKRKLEPQSFNVRFKEFFKQKICRT